MLTEDPANAHGRLWVFGHHIEVAATAGSGEFVAKAEVVDLAGQHGHGIGVGAAVEELILPPCLAHEPSHALKVVALDGIVHFQRVGLHLAQELKLVVLVEEHAAHDVGQDLLGRARDAGVVEQVAVTVFGSGEEIVGEPSCLRPLVPSRLGMDELHARQQSAELILPAAARSEQLFEDERAVADLGFVPATAQEVAERAQHVGGQDAARTQSGSRRNGREQRDLDAAAKVAQLVAERGKPLLAEVGKETAERQCRLGNGEGIAHMVEVGELLIARHRLAGPQVDTSDDDMIFAARLHVGLDGRLAVEFYGEVHHVATLKDAVGRRVGPSAGDVDAHGRASPYNLVVAHPLRGSHLMLQGLARNALGQEAEGPALVFVGMRVGTEQTAHHGVADALHQGSRGREPGGKGQAAGVESFRGILQVELIEDAVGVIDLQGLPVGTAKIPPLRFQPAEVGPGGDLFGTEQVAVAVAPAAHIIVETGPCVEKREARSGLCLTGELIQIAVSAHHPAFLTDGDEVDAVVGAERDGPIVVGGSCHDIVSCQFPSRSHTAVLHPDVLVLVGEPDGRVGVLHEDAGAGLLGMVHDEALVVDQTLNGHRGGEQFVGSAEVVEFTTGQRQHSHFQSRHERILL